MQELETLTFKGAPMATKGNEVSITKMPLNKIKLGRNSRANIDKDELEGLMESIKTIGLLQPIGVVENGTGYDIAYGNRRFLACSKLGMSHIPAIIHATKTAADIDIKNLAENVQRKNISLAEVGRYANLLGGEGVTVREMSVRLGCSVSYIKTCIDAYKHVPSEFRKDIQESNSKRDKSGHGKISPQAAHRILAAKRTFRLEPEQVKSLFRAAKSDKFQPQAVEKYAIEVKGGNEDFLKTVDPLKYVKIDIIMTQKEYDRLHNKHISNGIFKSMNELCKAILTGKKSEVIRVEDKK